MIEIIGTYNSAICYCDELEENAAEQIRMVCEQPEFADNKIRNMPDVHTGIGCTIGTTMTIKDKVVPGMVGVDIGCGMETVEIAERNIDLKRLDAVIYKGIPAQSPYSRYIPLLHVFFIIHCSIKYTHNDHCFILFINRVKHHIFMNDQSPISFMF